MLQGRLGVEASETLVRGHRIITIRRQVIITFDRAYSVMRLWEHRVFDEDVGPGLIGDHRGRFCWQRQRIFTHLIMLKPGCIPEALFLDLFLCGGRLLKYLHVLRGQLQILQTLLEVSQTLQQALILVARYLDL